MHFRAPHRNLAITLLLTSVTSCNDEHPDTTSDTDATTGTGTATVGTATHSKATAGGNGSQAEESDDADGRPNDR